MRGISNWHRTSAKKYRRDVRRTADGPRRHPPIPTIRVAWSWPPVIARPLVCRDGPGKGAAPHRRQGPGQDRFVGRTAHSTESRDAEPFRGQRVLVIGFGSSGGEIAIDLHEHGAHAAVSVRGPGNIIPPGIVGIPVLALGIALGPLPTGLADVLAGTLARLVIGDIT